MAIFGIYVKFLGYNGLLQRAMWCRNFSGEVLESHCAVSGRPCSTCWEMVTIFPVKNLMTIMASLFCRNAVYPDIVRSTSMKMDLICMHLFDL